jgi:hypothetical protein
MRPLSTLLLSTLLLAPACADDGVRAADFDGLWLMTSMTLPTDDGTITVSRDGTPQGLRGDAVFTATDGEHAALAVRQVLLQDGLIASEVQAMDLAVLVEEDRWVLTDDDDEVTVFTTALDDDHLVLTPDADDPRHTAGSPPSEVVLDRAEPWSTRLVGDWELVSMELPSGEIVADTCFEIQPDLWVTVSMDIAIDERQLFERLMTLTRWTDAACTLGAQQQESLQVGYGEDDGVTLRMWATEEGSSEYQAFTISGAGDELTLSRTDCLPLPACEDEAPLEVVVHRAP